MHTPRYRRRPLSHRFLVVSLLLALSVFLAAPRAAHACGGCATGSCSSACRCGCGGSAGGGGGGGAAAFSGSFDAWNVQFLSNRSLAQLSLSGATAGITGSGLTGWTDPLTGREYGIIGLSNTTAFLDVTNPANPVFLGEMPTETGNTGWREMQTYQNHVFVVSDGNGDHGMQVMDLTRLRGVTTPQLFTPDTVYRQNGFQTAHTITVNEAAGYAFLNGSNQFFGGVNIVDISNPQSPTFLAGSGFPTNFPNHLRGIHDAQSVRYAGPDTRFTGRDLLIASNGNDGITVIDVTGGVINAISPVTGHPGLSFAHQGSFTEDHRYFIANDEADENFTTFTRTHIWDFADLTSPLYLGYYQHDTFSTDHNLFIRGSLLYESNYLAGLRVFDLSSMPSAISSALATRAPGDFHIPNAFTPIAYFDAHPTEDFRGFSGSWHNYPYFNSGTILVSDIQYGVFMVRLTANSAAPEPASLLLVLAAAGGGGSAFALSRRRRCGRRTGAAH